MEIEVKCHRKNKSYNRTIGDLSCNGPQSMFLVLRFLDSLNCIVFWACTTKGNTSLYTHNDKQVSVFQDGVCFRYNFLQGRLGLKLSSQSEFSKRVIISKIVLKKRSQREFSKRVIKESYQREFSKRVPK